MCNWHYNQWTCEISNIQPKPNHVKHFEKISSVFGGHIKSINFSPREWEGYYAYSSRVGGELCLLLIRPTIEEGVGIISLPQLRLVMCESLVHDEVALCFMIGKSHGWGTFPNALGYRLIQDSLFWEWMPPS